MFMIPYSRLSMIIPKEASKPFFHPPTSPSQHLVFRGKLVLRTACGLFAIAIATYLAYGKDPDALCSHHFNQELLRGHLVSCLEDKLFVKFP